MRLAHSLLIVVTAMTAGCTHTQLRRITMNQAGTWTDLQYQQVLDNIAMFCANPGALPAFAVAGTGVAQVSDTGSTTDMAIPDFLSGGIWSGQYGLTASRQLSEQWALAPTTDPDKLKAMRIAYQMVVSDPPPDSKEWQDAMSYIFGTNTPEQADLCESFPRGWFQVGHKHDVPKKACYVGHYCKTYVWVMPNQVEGLTKFALTILNIATLDPLPATGELTLYDYNADKTLRGQFKATVRGLDPATLVQYRDTILKEIHLISDQINRLEKMKSERALNPAEEKDLISLYNRQATLTVHLAATQAPARAARLRFYNSSQGLQFTPARPSGGVTIFR